MINQLRKRKPLILCLTNYVTMDLMANSLLALGAAPLMSVCDHELEALIKLSQAIMINLGTLDKAFIERSELAIQLAKHDQKPIVLDPVGAGASLLRTETARAFMPHADIIRGNASEILALTDNQAKTLGVESTHLTEQAEQAASTLATQLNNTIVVSGQVDLITDGKQTVKLAVGSPLMSLVTGMGCTLTAVIAAFRSILSDSFEASKLASNYFGLCGERAEHQTKHPGSFRSQFIDELYQGSLST